MDKIKRKMILDIDSAGDDILAILYAARNEVIDLLGVTTVKGAAGDINQVTNVALKTVEVSGKDIKVYRGSDIEIAPRPYVYSGDPVNFEQELRPILGDRIEEFNVQVDDTELQAEDEDAVSFIYRTCKEWPNEIFLVATGPLTNVANLIQKHQDIGDYLKKICVLGGCFDTPGNMTPVVEYNIFADPEAAKIVFNSGIPIDLIPLDICENNDFADTMLTRDDLFELSEKGGEIARYVVDKFPIYIDIWRNYFDLVGFPLDDVMTVAMAIYPEWFQFTEPLYIGVETEGDLSRGQTVAFRGRQLFRPEEAKVKKTRIAIDIQGKTFLNDFKKALLD